MYLISSARDGFDGLGRPASASVSNITTSFIYSNETQALLDKMFRLQQQELPQCIASVKQMLLEQDFENAIDTVQRSIKNPNTLAKMHHFLIRAMDVLEQLDGYIGKPYELMLHPANGVESTQSDVLMSAMTREMWFTIPEQVTNLHERIAFMSDMMA